MNKVLVIDDDDDILILVKMTLARHGYNVMAISMWECVDSIIKKFEPNLILLDISLNGADGREICKQIKLQKDTCDIPVILFSANIEMKNSHLECKAEAFISKPCEVNHFLKTISLYLTRTATSA